MGKFWVTVMAVALTGCIGVCDARQKALVIGASSGIGRQVAQLLARDYDVGLVSRRLAVLEAVQDEIKSAIPDSKTWVRSIDVSADNAMEELSNFIGEMGGLSLIVISVTSYPDTQGKPCLATDRATLNVELLGFWKMAYVAMEVFKKQGFGHLVGISSVDALRGNPACPIYSAAKAFVSRYLEGVRNSLRMQSYKNIFVTDVLPGYVQTEGFDACNMPGAYWIASAHDAAVQICDAIKGHEKRVFITRRWWIIGWLMNHLPDWLFYDVIGGL
ncbi:TPA: hypothetical protein DDZ86_01830 [Candidatus Dependentiae bacterium]|nr:MAG: Short-chain dehydrogenase/reductase SDR [candidate division TM6 bacterium GW2011_GWF2_43_87]HBL98364.1 hypothetical protein [Candidatus Dependentiae bacterium]